MDKFIKLILITIITIIYLLSYDSQNMTEETFIYMYFPILKQSN
jgi:hypothetical protein